MPRNGISKRALQACSNCRRKKVKCPEERPKCSNCSRLSQACVYQANTMILRNDTLYIPQSHTENDMQSDVESNIQVHTPQSIESYTVAAQDPIPSNTCARHVSGIPSQATILQVALAYFEYCHRQPLWIFEDIDDINNACRSPEILYPMVTLTREFVPGLISTESFESVGSTSAAARHRLLSSIALGNVTIATIQGLCLLSFYNYTATDLALGRLHLSLVQTLLQESGLDSRPVSLAISDTRIRSRLFWSIQVLDYLYGPSIRSICVTSDASDPFYFHRLGVTRPLFIQCPLLPEETSAHSKESIQGRAPQGVWSVFLQMLSVWQLVRNYIAECAEGRNNSPWSPESAYTEICSALNEAECLSPSFHRYVNSRFSEQTSDEVHAKRSYWLVWIEVQITYHTIHCIINHPFLYSQEASKHKRGPNMFWKTSSELALLHSTWVAKLVNMAAKKQLQIHDPHLSRCAAIAATLQFYFSRTVDSSISAGATANLNKCRTFVQHMATLWPVCNHVSGALDKVIERATWMDSPATDTSGQMALSTPLMWDILGYSTTKISHPTKELFHPGFHISNATMDQPKDTTVARPSCAKSPEVLCAQNSNVASSPTWFGALSTTVQDKADARLPQIQSKNGQQEDVHVNSNDQSSMYVVGDDGLYDNTLMDLNYGIFTQPFDLDGSDLDRWDFGTL